MPETNPTRCFLDTNVWLYAFVATQGAAKSDIAKGLIQSNEIIVSAQVINEVSINLIKKAQFDEVRIQRLIASFYARQQVIESGKEVLLTASDLRSRYRFSFWDSLIIASAIIGESSIVYSEDMDDGLLVDKPPADRESFPARPKLNQNRVTATTEEKLTHGQRPGKFALQQGPRMGACRG